MHFLEDDRAREFWKLHGTEDQLAYRLADILRYGLRAPASRSHTTAGNLMVALEGFLQPLEAVEHVDLYQVCAQAVRHLQRDTDYSENISSILNNIGEDGAAMLAEVLSPDRAAQGRASKKRSALIQEIERFNEVREQNRKRLRR